MAAMTWAEKSSFKSDFATRAAVVHVAQRIHSSIEVVDQEHLPHTKEYDWNWRCDLRTRDKEMTWAKIVEADTRDPKGSRLDDRMEEWDVEGAEEILELCNPNRAGGVDAEFVAEVLRCDTTKLWLGVVVGKDPLRDMEQLAQFSDNVLVVFVMLTMVSGASPCKAAHCPATKP